MLYIDTTRAVQIAPSLSTLPSEPLGAFLNAASQAAERLCDRVFTRGTFVETQDGYYSRSIFVRNTPLVSITTIKIKDSSGNVTVYANTLFRFTPSTGEIRWNPDESGYFPDGFQNVEVTYVGGYDPLPFDLQSAIIQGAAYFVEMERTTRQAVQERLGDYIIRYENRMSTTPSLEMWPPMARAILGSFMERITI